MAKSMRLQDQEIVVRHVSRAVHKAKKEAWVKKFNKSKKGNAFKKRLAKANKLFLEGKKKERKLQEQINELQTERVALEGKIHDEVSELNKHFNPDVNYKYNAGNNCHRVQTHNLNYRVNTSWITNYGYQTTANSAHKLGKIALFDINLTYNDNEFTMNLRDDVALSTITTDFDVHTLMDMLTKKYSSSNE